MMRASWREDRRAEFQIQRVVHHLITVSGLRISWRDLRGDKPRADNFSFAATVLDIHDALVKGVPFRWQCGLARPTRKDATSRWRNCTVGRIDIERADGFSGKKATGRSTGRPSLPARDFNILVRWIPGCFPPGAVFSGALTDSEQAFSELSLGFRR